MARQTSKGVPACWDAFVVGFCCSLVTNRPRRGKLDGFEHDAPGSGDLSARLYRKKILFLCTGNYYRSRFAEHLFNALAEKRGLDWRADSRGLALERGVNNVGAISSHAVQGLAVRGLTVPGDERLPRQVTTADFATADKIIALDESEHRPLIAERFPRWTDAVEYWLIHDLGKTPPESAFEQIEQRVQQLVDRLHEGSARK
jgi:protein-tyrosine phosphatase